MKREQRPVRHLRTCDCFKNDAIKLIEHLQTNCDVKKCLKNFSEKICEELKNWIKHFQNEILGVENPAWDQYLHNNIDPNWCVWLPNGEIDYRNTAVNILSIEGLLSEEQKFLIMCKYCMEAEIETFASTVPEYISVKMNYPESLVHSYWTCYLKNVLHQICDENHASVYCFMIDNLPHDGWWFAKEYFWLRMGDDEQEIMAAHWVDECILEENDRNCIALEKMISSMTWSQQYTLLILMQKLETIIVNFSLRCYPSQCAFWAWTNFKNHIAPERFAAIVCNIFEMSRDTTGSFSSLIAIWNSAYAYQRNFVLETRSEFLIQIFLSRASSGPQWRVAPQFLNAFFSSIPLDLKKKFIFQAKKLFTSAPFYKLHLFKLDLWSNLLNACFPCSDDQMELRKLIPDLPTVRDFCLKLLYQQKYNECILKVTHYFMNDLNAARTYQQELLEEVSLEGDISLIFNASAWNKLSTYIDKIFYQGSSSALKMKQQLITLMAANCRYNPRLRQGFDTMVKIVENIFKNEELENVKRVFANSFCASVKESEFEYSWYEENCDKMLLQTFIEWASN